MSNRIEWIDVAKGMLIILVILGHSTTLSAINIIIYSFHMAAFFMLSGFTFSNKKITWKEYIKKQFHGLIIPYLFLSAIMLFYFFAKARFLNLGEFDFVSGIESVFLPISGRNATSVYGLWFLPCTLIAKTVFFAMVKIRQKIGWVILLFASLSILAYIIFRMSGVVSVVTIAPFAVIFMIAGKYLKERYVKFNSLLKTVLMFAVYVVSLVTNILFFEKSIDLSSLNIGNPILFVMHSISGSFLLFRIASKLENIKFLSKIGTKSLYYYGLHYEVIGFLGAMIFRKDILVFALLQTILAVVVLYTGFFIYDMFLYKFLGRKNND